MFFEQFKIQYQQFFITKIEKYYNKILRHNQENESKMFYSIAIRFLIYIMEMYTVARMFRNFYSTETRTFEYPENIIYLSGSDHSKILLKFFRTLEHTVYQPYINITTTPMYEEITNIELFPFYPYF